jgi:hypothetical protein
MLKRVLVELGRTEIPVHALEFFEAEFVGAEGTVMHARLLHEDSPSNPRCPGANAADAPLSQ